MLGSDAFESSDAQVRLSALLAIAESPAAEGVGISGVRAIVDSKNQNDRWMLDAATSAAATSGGDFLALVCGQTSASPALRQATSVVAEHVARSRDGETIQKVVRADGNAPPDVTGAIIDGWSKGWPKGFSDQLRSCRPRMSLLELFDRLAPGSKGQLIRLAKSFGSKKLAKNAEKIAATLLEIAGDDRRAGRDAN